MRGWHVERGPGLTLAAPAHGLCGVIHALTHSKRERKLQGKERAQQAAFIGSLVVVLVIVLGVFTAEVYYTADTLGKPNCVQALKNATKTDDPLITTSTIIFSLFDALLVLLVILELAFTSCTFSAGAELSPYPDQEQESARLLSRPSDKLLAVEITRAP